MLSEIEKDYARENERTRELNNENQQLAKYIDRLQNEMSAFVIVAVANLPFQLC